VKFRQIRSFGRDLISAVASVSLIKLNLVPELSNPDLRRVIYIAAETLRIFFGGPMPLFLSTIHTHNPF
jgi:hypothetical protein